MHGNIFIDYKVVDNRGPVKGVANVTIASEYGEFMIRGFDVIHQPGKEPWVAMPRNSYKDSSGHYQNFEILIPGIRFRHFITESILKEHNKSSAQVDDS